MKNNRILKLQIIEKVLRIFAILSFLLWSYRIYLSILSFSESVSAPWYIELLYSTRFYLAVTIIIFLVYLIVRKNRMKYTKEKYKLHMIEKVRRHPLKFFSFSIISLILLFGIVIVLIQPLILYHPNHSNYAYEQLKELDSYEEFKITDDKLTYQGFGKVDVSEKLPTIIYFAGNGESSAQTFYHYHLSNIFEHFEGFQFIMIDYPEYGLSDGKTQDKTILRMGEAIYEYVYSLDYVDQEQIYIYGYSIGTGVSTYIASKYDVKGLILIAPYSSITDLFNSSFPIFKGVFKYLVVEDFESTKYAVDVKVSPLIIASLKDRTIPFALSEKLSNSFNDVHEFYVIDNTEHSDFLKRDDVITKIVQYINS